MFPTALPLVAALCALSAWTLPAVAQPAPPPAPSAPSVVMLRDGPARAGLGLPGLGLAALSPEGRAIVQQAIRESRDPETRAAIQVARARILQLMAADRLDVGAFERALGEERALALRQQERAHRALLATVQKLSPADRKALADAGLRARERVEGARAMMLERRMRQPAPAPAMPPTP